MRNRMIRGTVGLSNSPPDWLAPSTNLGVPVMRRPEYSSWSGSAWRFFYESPGRRRQVETARSLRGRPTAARTNPPSPIRDT